MKFDMHVAVQKHYVSFRKEFFTVTQSPDARSIACNAYMIYFTLLNLKERDFYLLECKKDRKL